MANPARPSDARMLMQRHQAHARKSFGQNFLVDQNILEKIVQCAQIDGQAVLEIGPGLGALTVALARRARQVTAVEVDAAMLPVLAETLADYPNVRVIAGDILAMDWHMLAAELGGAMHVVANLPYHVATTIISRMLEAEVPVTQYTVMVQKEVAQRICAAPGTAAYGMLSVAVQFFASARMLFDVPPGAFLPKPNVTSTILSITPYLEPEVYTADRNLFFQVARAAFSNRRKTMINNLHNMFPVLSKEILAGIMSNLNLDTHIRGECLSLPQIALLTEKILQQLGAF